MLRHCKLTKSLIEIVIFTSRLEFLLLLVSDPGIYPFLWVRDTGIICDTWLFLTQIQHFIRSYQIHSLKLLEKHSFLSISLPSAKSSFYYVTSELSMGSSFSFQIHSYPYPASPLQLEWSCTNTNIIIFHQDKNIYYVL